MYMYFPDMDESLIWVDEWYCICIMTEHEANPMIGAQGISWGLRLNFTVHPNLTFTIYKSYTFSIVLPLRAILEELILHMGLAAGAIFSCIAQ